MDTTTIVILGVVAVAVILLIALAASRARSTRPKLTPLSDEARERFATQWDRVEARFVDAPEEAVREADGVLTAMLRERQHPMTQDSLPNGIQRARRLAVGDEGKGGTEGMRQAMLQYRAVMEEYGRPVGEHKHLPDERREIAS
jgi:hypothetical protein